MPTLIRFVSLIVVEIVCCSAQATLFTVDVTAVDGTHSQQTIPSTAGTTTTLLSGTKEWQGTIQQAGSYSIGWDLLLSLDSRPSITGSFTVTNTLPSAQTFILSVSDNLNITPAAGNNIILGSSAISVADDNGDFRATLNPPPGSAIYTAFINSPAVNQATLFGDPYKLEKLSIFGAAADAQSIAAGLRTTTAIITSMGIQHSFKLTGHDSATMNSTFGLIPEPCSIVLAAIGAIGLAVGYLGRSTKDRSA